MATTRKLAAILATDVVGYSRLMQTDETGTLAAMKALWNEVVQPSVRAHRGRVFKLMGDGMLAEFASIVDAANAAETIQTAANERVADHGDDKAIRLRIGINLGDVVVDGSDLYGDGVNIAARLQEVAPVGGIAVSSGTHDYLRGKGSIVFSDGGERSLKNIDQPVRVWLWPSSAREPSASAPASPTARRSSQPSIAVLPFQNLSSDPDAEFFADGMTEDVINALSKFRWLFVIARGTMFTYKGKSVGIPQAASDLGVRYIVEGSVRQAGNNIRLSAQLVDTEAGQQLWSQRFDRQVDDIFAIQDEITTAIAGAVAPEIERFERQRAEALAPTEIDAWLIFQKGQSASHDRSEAKTVEAIEYFDRVTEIDPKFVPALAMSAISRMILANVYQGERLDILSQEAIAKTEQATSTDPSDPLAMLANARIQSGLGNHTQAIALARQAINANPNNAFAHQRAAHATGVAALFDDCIYHSNMVLTLSPFDPNETMVKGFLAFCYLAKDEYQKGLDIIQSARNQTKMNINLRCVIPILLMKLGRMDEARSALRRVHTDYPNLSVEMIRSGNRNYAAAFINPYLEGLRELGVPEE